MAIKDIFLRIYDFLRHPNKIALALRNFYLDYKYQRRIIIDWKRGASPAPEYHHASPTHSFVLPYIFKDLNIRPDDVLVDLGCGRGRVINWWLDQGLRNKIIGVEIDTSIAQETGERLARFKNVQIVNRDVIEFIPADGTVFFIYNSFGERPMRVFNKKLKQLFSNKHITIVYYNCVHISIFENDSFWQVCLMSDMEKKGYKKGALIQNRIDG
ncbi:rRNA adenine N-6-methyltransferase family protein [Candidatus Omnitrophota bacterium]